MAPRIVFVMRDRAIPRTRHRIPAIVGIRVCAACRRQVSSIDEVLAPDERDRLAGVLTRMRAGADLERTLLEWTPTSSREFRMLEHKPS